MRLYCALVWGSGTQCKGKGGGDREGETVWYLGRCLCMCGVCVPHCCPGARDLTVVWG